MRAVDGARVEAARGAAVHELKGGVAGLVADGVGIDLCFHYILGGLRLRSFFILTITLQPEILRG
jgi:hypothetical protein